MLLDKPVGKFLFGFKGEDAEFRWLRHRVILPERIFLEWVT
jgi:hypothetical protein